MTVKWTAQLQFQVPKSYSGNIFCITTCLAAQNSNGKEHFRKYELLNCCRYIFSAFSTKAYYSTEIYTTINCDTKVKFLITEWSSPPITRINVSPQCRTRVNAYTLQTPWNSIFCRPTVLKKCKSHWDFCMINIYNKDSKLAHIEGLILKCLPVRTIPSVACSETVYSFSRELSQASNVTVLYLNSNTQFTEMSWREGGIYTSQSAHAALPYTVFTWV